MNQKKIILYVILFVIIMVGFFIFKFNPKTSQIPSTETPGQNDDMHEPSPISDKKEFSKPVLFKVNDTVTFTDSMTVTLKEINDSRCKPGVQCIWAGELSVLFSVLFPVAHPTKDVRLGTTNNKTATVDGYTFILENATEKTAILIISPKKSPISTGGCYVGGCSSQICSDQKDAVSTCEYRAVYACYQTATCERQKTGLCGWTETTELSMCIDSKKSQSAPGVPVL